MKLFRGLIIGGALSLVFWCVLFAVLWSTYAHAHDWKRPDLDSWYQGLNRKSVTRDGSKIPCCSREDCHTTEAELRSGEWWARLGKPVRHPEVTDQIDWELEDYVRVPNELIVRDDRGMPVPNPEGVPVICHNITWKAQSWMTKGGGVLDPQNTTIYCFVPPNQI